MDRIGNHIGPKICRSSRRGLLYLGALREIFLISLVAGIVLCILTDVRSLFRWHSSFDEDHAQVADLRSVARLDLDFERESLIVHSWPGLREEIDLKTGSASRLRAPRDLIGSATSRFNSTSILISQWANEGRVFSEVNIIRGDVLLVSEQLDFKVGISADVHISRDGSVAFLVGHNGRVIVWEMAASEPRRWEYQLDCNVSASSISPDACNIFVSNCGKTAIVCEAKTGTVRIRVPETAGSSRSTAWSDDNRLLAVADRYGRISVFEVSTCQTICQLEMNFLFASCLAFSDDGGWLAAGGFDKKIRLWNLTQSSNPLTILSTDSSIVRNLVFRESNSLLISGSADGTIHEWSIADAKIRRRLR